MRGNKQTKEVLSPTEMGHWGKKEAQWQSYRKIQSKNTRYIQSKNTTVLQTFMFNIWEWNTASDKIV